MVLASVDYMVALQSAPGEVWMHLFYEPDTYLAPELVLSDGVVHPAVSF